MPSRYHIYRSLDDIVIANGAPCLRHVFYAALMGSFDIVSKREKRVGAEGDAGHRRQPFSPFLRCQRLRLPGKYLLPFAVAEDIIVIFGDIYVDSVVSVRTLEILLKRKTQSPSDSVSYTSYVRFVARQSGAVNS